MRVGVFLLLLGLIGAALIVCKAALDRDSRAYRMLSRTVGRVIPVERPAQAISVPFEDDAATGVPRKEWTRSKWGAVAEPEVENGLAVVATSESVWWMNRRGPMLSVPVEGDVQFTGSVMARKASDFESWPDMEWQFAGIILRAPESDGLLAMENYVFVVVGHRGSRLQVEFKSTVDGDSEVHAIDWPAGDAELGLVRRGRDFQVFARELDTEQWTSLHEFTRPDLPAVLQAGLIVYAFSEGRGRHDLQARFREVALVRP